MWDYCGMERTAEGLEKALGEIPALHDEFRKDLRVPGRPRRQPDAREGRAGRRLLRAGHAHVPGRAGPQRELRRPLPGRVPDRGRRGAARRRALRLRRGVGVDRRPGDARAPQGAARVRERPPRRSGATSRCRRSTSRSRSGARTAPTTPGSFETIDGARHQRRHVVPRDARRRQRAADQRGRGADHLRPRLPRGHLRHVLAHDQRPGPRARSGARPPASSTCASSTTATRS